jgi:AAA+ ATPase superfamily predicted ATPase
MAKFIGRQEELRRLFELSQKKTSSFVVVRGRRRIGKSRLIEEFGKKFSHFYSFVGLPPEKKMTREDQLNEFSRQISKNFSVPLAIYQDWSDALGAVGERVQSGSVLLLFDEISWMGTKDPHFLGKIKNFWDLSLKKNDHLIFVICGSASAWIEENILSNTGFVGRISLTLTLRELNLMDCDKFWPKNISIYEKLKVLAITGGIPKYLEEVNPHQTAEENIKRLCFMDGGLLVDEFRQIFSSLFNRNSDQYQKILHILAKGNREQIELQKELGQNTLGRIAEYLHELELSGFISRDYTLNFKKSYDSKLSKYRLSDNYIRFYLKYIEKNLSKIKRGMFAFSSLLILPEWFAILGLQFENTILNNRKILQQIIGIKPEEVVSENPYFQRSTAHQNGCQIDYLVQTRFDTLYICEIKCKKHEIDFSIINEVEKKIAVLKRPKRFSCRPVLVHVNGVSQDVVDSRYFANIVSFEELFHG